MSSIYIETVKSTAETPLELVMLHGWAMHSGLMQNLAERLSGQFTVHMVDLPGHGNSSLNGSAFEINSLANDIYSEVSQQLDGKAVWLGWSLGGLIALKITEMFPASVSKLVLLASSPAFVKQHDWQHAVDNQIFVNFANDLKHDLQSTITRFLSLQVRGADDGRQTLKKLREIVFAKQVANQGVLNDGLKILEQTDLRKALDKIKIPMLLLGGERDTLVPKAAIMQLANNENIETSIIEKAGHAPFISHPEQCAEIISGFIHV